MGPKAVLDAVMKRKIPSPRRESNPLPSAIPTELSRLYGTQRFINAFTRPRHWFLSCEKGCFEDRLLGRLF